MLSCNYIIQGDPKKRKNIVKQFASQVVLLQRMVSLLPLHPEDTTDLITTRLILQDIHLGYQILRQMKKYMNIPKKVKNTIISKVSCRTKDHADQGNVDKTLMSSFHHVYMEMRRNLKEILQRRFPSQPNEN